MKHIKNLANMAAALEITGAGRDLSGLRLLDWGPDHVLRRTFRDKTTSFEILPKFLAELVVTNIPAEEPEVQSARLHDRVPEDAPRALRKEWAERIMAVLFKAAPVFYAI